MCWLWLLSVLKYTLFFFIFVVYTNMKIFLQRKFPDLRYFIILWQLHVHCSSPHKTGGSKIDFWKLICYTLSHLTWRINLQLHRQWSSSVSQHYHHRLSLWLWCELLTVRATTLQLRLLPMLFIEKRSLITTLDKKARLYSHYNASLSS